MKITLLLTFLLFSVNILANDQVKVFISLSPAGSFEAVSSKLKGKLKVSGKNYVTDKLSVLVSSFKTGIDLRDDHFQKHLNAKKFSKIEMSNVTASAGKGQGDLMVSGVTKRVDFTYKEDGKFLIANMKLKASDFKLPKAQYLGVGVNDDLVVETKISKP
jgi:hypothetical protein